MMSCMKISFQFNSHDLGLLQHSSNRDYIGGITDALESENCCSPNRRRKQGEKEQGLRKVLTEKQS